MSAQVTPFEVQSDVRQTEATEYVLASTLALLIYDQGNVRKALKELTTNFSLVICSDVEVRLFKYSRPFCTESDESLVRSNTSG